MRDRLRAHATQCEPATAAAAARPPEAGFTLVEMLVSVTIMTIAILGAAGTMFTMTVVSDFERRQALAEVEARRLVEAIRAAPYDDCASAEATYESYFDDVVVEAGATADITNMKFWLRDTASPLNVSAGQFKTYAAYQAAGYCQPLATDDAKKTDHGLQRMTVTVTVGSNPPAKVSFEVSKRLSQF